MARYKDPMRPARNTAPMWKKVTVVLAAPVAMIIVITVLHASTWNFFVFAVVLIGVAILAVLGMAKLLGVHLSLGSWD
jgi:hypothetical protein